MRPNGPLQICFWSFGDILPFAKTSKADGPTGHYKFAFGVLVIFYHSPKLQKQTALYNKIISINESLI